MARRSKRERSRMQDIELTWPNKGPLVEPRLAASGDLRIIERMGARGNGQRNLLVHGDNLLAMHALCDDLEGQIDLIYIDPPYATGMSYYTLTKVGGEAVERRAYRDQPVGGMVGYLEHMRHRLTMMRRLLSDQGKLFLHCDWRANSALRILLDEIFGSSCFRNEIVWRRAPNLGRQAASNQLGRVFDSIYVYSKEPGTKFAGPVPRRRALVALDGKGKPKGARWDDERECYFTTAPRGDYTDASIAKLRKAGRVYDSSTGKIYIKYFLTKGDDGRWYKEQPVDAIWDDFDVRPLRHRPKREDMGYDTQKPEGLLERIIGWATKPGDLVADFYAGSGTTAAVADAMGRRWLSTDIGQASICVTRRRLLERDAASFDIASVERVEWQLWEDAQPDGGVAAVLKAYGAEPVEGRWGQRAGARVLVAPLGVPVGEGDIVKAAQQAKDHESVEVVACEWGAFDIAAVRARVLRDHAVGLTLRTIPVELIRASNHSGLCFSEPPEIDVEVIGGADGPCVRLSGMRCAESSEAARCWSDLVDSWMVDWRKEHAGPFEAGWHSYRGRDRELAFETAALDPNVEHVVVKIITVFGEAVVRALPVP